MSLINDALKRAKEAQSQPQGEVKKKDGASKSVEPAMRPTEAPKENSSPIYLMFGALVVVLIGAVILLWLWSGSNSSQRAPQDVAAKAPSAPVPPGAKPTPIPPVAPPAPIPQPVTPAPAVAQPPTPLTPATATEVPEVPTVESKPVEVVAAVPAVPQFPTLKLQGIFYNSTKPSTVINGKTYFTGGTVSGARIVQIEVDKVTVEWNGEQRVLETAQ